MSCKKKTRRYKAAIRNGHYTPTQTTTNSLSDKQPSITKARRRLQFGRKPPKDHKQDDLSDVKYTLVSNKETTSLPSTSSYSSCKDLQKGQDQKNQTLLQKKDGLKNPGIRLKKELQFLLKDADHVVYPVRLRSSLHSLMTCHTENKHYSLHHTSEQTPISFPTSSRHS